MGGGYWINLAKADPKWTHSRQSHKREKREYRRLSSLGKPVRYPIVKFSGILPKSGRQRWIEILLAWQPVVPTDYFTELYLPSQPPKDWRGS